MLRQKNKVLKKVSLVVLVLAMVAVGYLVYLRGLAATATITRAACEKLVHEANWQIQATSCVGPNGVILTITQ